MNGNNHQFSSILLIEDEASLAATLEVALAEFSPRKIRHALNLRDARALFQAAPVDLLVIDRQLPDGDGVDFCREIRGRGYRGMILFLTARGAVEDRIEGLSSGADDYLAKPFSLDELKARVTALARRTPPDLASAMLSPLWKLEVSKLEVWGPLGPVTLTPLEFKMVKHLIEAAGSIVSRETLLKEVWGFRFLPQTRTVDYFMGRLRKKFEIDPDSPRHFLTVRGAGYRFEH